jgi:hypothetical protein
MKAFRWKSIHTKFSHSIHSQRKQSKSNAILKRSKTCAPDVERTEKVNLLKVLDLVPEKTKVGAHLLMRWFIHWSKSSAVLTALPSTDSSPLMAAEDAPPDARASGAPQ